MTFKSVTTLSIIKVSFNSNTPLVWTGSITGYFFLLITFAYPDWKVLAIPGLVVRPVKLNVTTHCVPAT